MSNDSAVYNILAFNFDGQDTAKQTVKEIRSSGALEGYKIVADAEDAIDAAYTDAAAALLAAELIDEANLDDVAGVIAEVWVLDED